MEGLHGVTSAHHSTDMGKQCHNGFHHDWKNETTGSLLSVMQTTPVR